MADLQQFPVHPDFSQYGPQLGAKLTAWLFGDPNASPYAKQKEKWFEAGRVATRDVTVQFASVGATSQAIDPGVNLGGSRNVIVFARSASVAVAAAPAVNAPPFFLPNSLLDYVDVQIQRQSGWIDTETAPISNVFGFGWAPHVSPVPECWLGNELRTITVFNRSLETITVNLTFHLALLDTGR
jgi:hypothetical protein